MLLYTYMKSSLKPVYFSILILFLSLSEANAISASSLINSCKKFASKIVTSEKNDVLSSEEVSSRTQLFSESFNSLSLSVRREIFDSIPTEKFVSFEGVSFELNPSGGVRIKSETVTGHLYDNYFDGNSMYHSSISLKKANGRINKYTSSRETQNYFSNGIPTVLFSQLFSYKSKEGKFGALKYFASIIDNETTGLQILMRSFLKSGRYNLENYLISQRELEDNFKNSQTERYMLLFFRSIGVEVESIKLELSRFDALDVSPRDIYENYGVAKKDFHPAYFGKIKVLQLQLPVFTVKIKLKKEQG